MLKFFLPLTLIIFTTVSQSQTQLPYGDLDEIERSKSILANYTCDDLTEKAKNQNFSLKNLAALRALIRNCEGFTFDITQLSDFERKLYAADLTLLSAPHIIEIKPPEWTIKDLQQAIKSEKIASEKFKLYKQLRLKQRSLPDRKDYLKTSEALLKWALNNYKLNKGKKDKTIAGAAFSIAYESAQLLAKAQWTENNVPEAEKAIEKALKVLKPKNSVAELYFLKARIEEEAKKPEEAVKLYDLTLADMSKYDTKNLSFNIDRVMWLKAWILYKEKKYDEAEPAFSSLAAATPDLSERSRSLFYQARCLKFLKQDDAAKKLLESIPQDDFFGYYGLVSYRELGKKLPALKTISPIKTLNIDLQLGSTEPNNRAIYNDLVKYRELGLAEKSIALIAKSKQEELNLSLNFAKNNKIYLPLFRAFSRLDNAEKIEVFIAYPDLIFPRPYLDEVKAMADKTKLPTSLIYSIMKQESAFNEKAHSGADAMGLMQVIPRLARQLAKKFEVPFNSNEDLYNPTTNIKLGSYELMEQVRRQNGQLTFVAAAYNAGPGALSGWLKNRKRDDILEFIEEIPYEETRTYVKLIARNKLFYERVSNQDTEYDFPADFLSN
jgi:soluble lytic murein transglycosylase